jgi:8-oxo-dGTP pyrophosphatase MutT (NUDIX family)
MENKTKKAQVVLAAVDKDSHSFAFLLLQTNQRRGSFWQNVTGSLEENETFEEGGLREAMEETQLNIDNIVDIITLNLSYDFVDQYKRHVREECFLIVLDEMWNVKLDPNEHESFKWVPLSEIHRDIVKFESNFEALEKASLLLKKWGV